MTWSKKIFPAFHFYKAGKITVHFIFTSIFYWPTLSAIMALRARFKDRFREKYQVSLGFTSFFVKASVEALKEFPLVNARIDGNDIVHQHFYDMGLTVAAKADSQDICFVPQGKYSDIIAKLRPLAANPGEIVHIDGRVPGRHEGILRYTIGQRRGIGIGMHCEFSGLQSERMEIRVDQNGSLTVHVGTLATGQGHETMYAQMVSDWLQVPFAHVRVLQGDTDRVLFGRGTYAGRSAVIGGSALKAAAEEVCAEAARHGVDAGSPEQLVVVAAAVEGIVAAGARGLLDQTRLLRGA